MNQLNPPPRKNWLSRNWKWFVPVGFLGVLVIIAGFVALIVSLIFGMMKSTDAYKDAMAKVKADPVVQSAIGTPIEESFFIMGSMHISGPSGQADLSIPISGPKGRGTIFIVAAKSAGQWTFSTLVVEIKDSGRRIDLLE